MDEVFCQDCIHYRLPYQPHLFTQRDLVREKGLDAQRRYQEREAQRRTKEVYQFDERADFAYKPHNYHWCNALTPCRQGFLRMLSDHLNEGEAELAKMFRKEAAEDSKMLQSLMDRARDGDRDARQELSRLRLYDGRDEVKLYAICEAVNFDYHCPLFEAKSTNL